MFPVSTPTRSASPTPVVQPPSARGILELTSLGQAKVSIRDRNIPKFEPDVAKALAGGAAPNDLDGPGTIGGMGTLQRRLAKYSDPYVLGRIARFVAKEAPIPQRTRDWYPRLLTEEGAWELNYLIPRFAALGSQFNNNERYALYAGLLQCLGDPEESLTTAPIEGSARHRIYNALFCIKTPCPDS